MHDTTEIVKNKFGKFKKRLFIEEDLSVEHQVKQKLFEDANIYQSLLPEVEAEKKGSQAPTPQPETHQWVDLRQKITRSRFQRDKIQSY